MPRQLRALAKSLDLSSINPLSFLKLYREDPALARALVVARRQQQQQQRRQRQLHGKTSTATAADRTSADAVGAVAAAVRNRRILCQLLTITGLQAFLEGKNVSDIVQIWQREHLGWDIFGMRNFTAAYGVACVLTGALLTPRLLRSLSPRAFTSFTNTTNAFGFVLRGATEIPAVFWCAVVPLLPGVNAASTQAFKSLIASRAVAAGVGRGELSAWVNNLRALCSAVAPVLYGNAYAFFRERDVFAGHVFTLAALVGAVLPEVLHRRMPADEVAPLSDAEAALVAEGEATAKALERDRKMYNSVSPVKQ